jgi:hypothetical protein
MEAALTEEEPHDLEDAEGQEALLGGAAPVPHAHHREQECEDVPRALDGAVVPQDQGAPTVPILPFFPLARVAFPWRSTAHRLVMLGQTLLTLRIYEVLGNLWERPWS